MPYYVGQVVIFVDEIDAVRSLPFSTDEFFAGIREFYNRRTEDEVLGRLVFCLLGVASPSDLIRNTLMTPFNIGRRIELHDFTEAEAAPLAGGLRREEKVGAMLLKRILHWTGGHPYLTQRLCQAVADDASVNESEGVDRLCEELFLTRRIALTSLLMSGQFYIRPSFGYQGETRACPLPSGIEWQTYCCPGGVIGPDKISENR